MWSKAGRFVEFLHIVGDILTKISANCVINLHTTLLFTCLFLWVIICAVIIVFILWVFPVYVVRICLLLFKCESVHLQMYLAIYVLYICFHKSYVCIYFKLHAVRKIYVAYLSWILVCYSMFHKENVRVLWHSVAQHSWLGTLHSMLIMALLILSIGFLQNIMELLAYVLNPFNKLGGSVDLRLNMGRLCRF
jgi:hypothetical protein